MKQFRILFLLLIALTCYIGVAQSTKKIDSLLVILQSVHSDTTRIMTYHDLHKEYVPLDSVQAIKYLELALDLSKSTGSDIHLCQTYLLICNYRWKKGNLGMAKTAIQEAERLLLNLENDKLRATFHMERGLVYYYGESYAKAVENFLKAAEKYKILNDNTGEVKCYSNIGICYMALKNADKALEYYLRAEETFVVQNDYRTLSGIWGNIGIVYRNKEDYGNALKYYEKSLKVNRKDGMKSSEAINLQNIGTLYLESGEFDKAMGYFQEAKKVCEEINDKIGILYADHGMGTSLVQLGRHNEAVSLLNSCLSVAEELHLKHELRDINFHLSEAYEKAGHLRKSLEHRKLFENWKDSINNKGHLDKIADLETKYKTVEKEKEIALLTKEKEIQEKDAHRKATRTNSIIGGLAAILLLAILLFYLFRQRVRNQKIVARKNAEITEVNFKQQLSELEMKALRAQMNPHFVFNCLNSINRMILGGDIKDASSYLTKFSRLIRKVLENSEKNMVSLADELTMLKAYIQLESLRFKGKISYKTEIDKHLNLDTTFIPSMVLQPLVENAIWHGLMHKEKGGTIKLSIEKENDILKCSIEDDGVGRDKNRSLETGSFIKEKSMGLQLTAERLRIMGKIGLKRFIEIIDLKDENEEAIGTRVDLLIPIE